jgi:hypothetical protein
MSIRESKWRQITKKRFKHVNEEVLLADFEQKSRTFEGSIQCYSYPLCEQEDRNLKLSKFHSIYQKKVSRPAFKEIQHGCRVRGRKVFKGS